jgi:uroporphyrin-III C-methyltransferase
MKPCPIVSLIGAGPGAADLLTVRAVKALRRATVVLVDDLVADAVLRYVRRSARIVPVGKRGGRPCLADRSPSPGSAGAAAGTGRRGARLSTPQDFICRLMITEAQRGERVVRLKGGDPFVFGRGAEEVDALRAAGLEVDVISGLSAGIAGPAAVGIPVTDRRHAPGVALVTGHAQDGGRGPDWTALARSGLTLVVYMGVARAEAVVQALRDGGLDADTPAAVVSAAHTPRQRARRCTLGTLCAVIDNEALASPALLVIGAVALCADLSLCPPAAVLGPEPAALPVRRSTPVLHHLQGSAARCHAIRPPT